MLCLLLACVFEKQNLVLNQFWLAHFVNSYKIYVLICLQKSDVIKLTSFQLRLCLILLMQLWSWKYFEAVFWSIYGFNVVSRKGIFWIILCRNFESVPRLLVFGIEVDGYVVDEPEPCLESLFWLSSPANVLFITCRSNDYIYQNATLTGHMYFGEKYISCCFQSMKIALL